MGVLNSEASRQVQERGGRQILDDSPPLELLRNLKRIVVETRCVIVVSSTWRLDQRKKRQLETALLQVGLSAKGVTPDLSKGNKASQSSRVNEILLWLEMCPVDAWVAIDDIDLLTQSEQMKVCSCAEHHFVRTDDAVGLTADKATEAVSKLSAQLKAV